MRLRRKVEAINFLSKRIYPFDLILIGYCLLMIALIFLLADPFGVNASNILFYLGMVTLSLVIVYFADESKSRWLAFIRYVYPAILFTFFYRATGDLVFMVFDRFLDVDLVAFETAIFGVSPSLYIDQNLTGSVIINELFSLGYFSYYFMIPTILIYAFVRREDFVVKSTMTSLTLVFFICYLLFDIFPVESPRWHLAEYFQTELPGGLFRYLTMAVVGKGGLHGGGMPSSHVSVALVTMMYGLRYYRRLGYLLLILNLLLIVGTVWGRFHYLSDALTGIFFGLIPVFFVWRYYDDRCYKDQNK